jgi:transcriptional regulator with XRE-family HTH domain
MNEIDFRSKIRKVLDRRKMSVPELANLAGCNQMAIYNYLAGRSEMKADLLAKILTALGIKLVLGDGQ